MATVRAMVLEAPRTPLVMRERALPTLGVGEVLLAVTACGVCRTDLHAVDGEFDHPKLPIVPGHEIVGRVAAVSAGGGGFSIGGALVPAALKVVRKGGRVVCGGIHMSDILSFPYALLSGEQHVVSVANLTCEDMHEFLAIAPQAGIKCEVTRYPLAHANEALSDLRDGRLQGAAVLIP